MGVVFFSVSKALLRVKGARVAPGAEGTLYSLGRGNVGVYVTAKHSFTAVPVFRKIMFSTVLTFGKSFYITNGRIITGYPVPGRSVRVVVRGTGEVREPISVTATRRVITGKDSGSLRSCFTVTRREIGMSRGFRRCISGSIFRVVLKYSLRRHGCVLGKAGGTGLTT